MGMYTHIKLHCSGKRTGLGRHGAADDNGCSRVSRIRRKVLRNAGRARRDSEGPGR